MKKVLVIGCPGSGKSTFSRALNKLTGIKLYHLDMFFWNADKTTVDNDVFDERLSNTLKNSEWIIDGNYLRTMELRLKECDTVFFLDYPLDVCLNGVKSRIGKERTDMPWIETEDDEEFIEFIKSFGEHSRPQILTLLSKYSDKNINIFTTRTEADEYLTKDINNAY